MCFSNELISRDEGLHQDFAIELLKLKRAFKLVESDGERAKLQGFFKLLNSEFLDLGTYGFRIGVIG